MRWVLLAIGIVLAADSFFAALVCNMNLGVVLPALIVLPLLLIGLFWNPALLFFSTAFGRVFKWILVGGYALFLASFAVVCGLITTRFFDRPAPGADCVIVLGAAIAYMTFNAYMRTRIRARRRKRRAQRRRSN